MFLELLVEQAPKIKILRIILENKMSIKDIAHLNLLYSEMKTNLTDIQMIVNGPDFGHFSLHGYNKGQKNS